jgi:uncharacterized protein (TIGR03435 family)
VAEPHPPDDQPGTLPFPMQFTPDGYRATETISEMIMRAYNPQFWLYWSKSTVQDAPAWVAKDMYDIDARVAESDIEAWQKVQGQNSDLLRSALKSVLRERFKLVLDETPIEVPYLKLMVNKMGAKLQRSVPGQFKPISGKIRKAGQGFAVEENGEMRFVGISMEEFAHFLTLSARDYPVQDETGLSGRYNFKLAWYDNQQCQDSEFSNPLDRMPLTSIGLTLKAGKGLAYIFIINHIERPEPN